MLHTSANAVALVSRSCCTAAVAVIEPTSAAVPSYSVAAADTDSAASVDSAFDIGPYGCGHYRMKMMAAADAAFGIDSIRRYSIRVASFGFLVTMVQHTNPFRQRLTAPRGCADIAKERENVIYFDSYIYEQHLDMKSYQLRIFRWRVHTGSVPMVTSMSSVHVSITVDVAGLQVSRRHGDCDIILEI